MKKYLSIVLIMCSALFHGCATSPQVTPEMGAAIVRLSVSAGATLTLKNNPRYIPVAGALAVGVDAAIGSSTTITLNGIATYVQEVCAKNNVPPEDVGIFIGLAQMIYTGYVSTYKPVVVSSSDPKVLLYVNAFKDGLNDAVFALGIGKK